MGSPSQPFPDGPSCPTLLDGCQTVACANKVSTAYCITSSSAVVELSSSFRRACVDRNELHQQQHQRLPNTAVLALLAILASVKSASQLSRSCSCCSLNSVCKARLGFLWKMWATWVTAWPSRQCRGRHKFVSAVDFAATFLVMLPDGWI